MLAYPRFLHAVNRLYATTGRGRTVLLVLVGLVFSLAVSARDQAPEPPPTTGPAVSNRVSYQLPTEGPLPKTYRVTLAAAPKDDPDWLVSNFLAGAARTVTEENQGRFTAVWNGLDDNFMPVPPGDYVVRGIYLPAKQWHMDRNYHGLTARYITAVGDSWSPPPEQDDKFPWIFGHSSGYLRDVEVAVNGLAAFQFHEIKDAWNPFLVDLHRPIAYSQVQAKYPSAGVGGIYTACDGEFVWVANPDAQAPHVYRTDRQWGKAINKYGIRCVALQVPPTDVCAWYDRQRQWRFVYVVQPAPANRILLYDGDGAALLQTMQIRNPRSVVIDKAAPGTRLYVLHQDDEDRWVVTALQLDQGRFTGKRELVLSLPDEGTPLDFDLGRDGAVYWLAADESRVRRLDPATGKGSAFGKPPRPGAYDKLSLYEPRRIAVWHDRKGQERILVVENDGPGRLSEWNPQGELLRQWFFSQTAGYGYCLDPQRPEHLYHVSNGNDLIRYEVNYERGSWQVDCVWPMPIGGRQNPRLVHLNDNTYITFPGGAFSDQRFAVYQIDGDQCLPSAGIIPDRSLPAAQQVTRGFWWRDANGNGQVEAAEYAAGRAQLPGTQYWGERWLDDLSLVVFDGDVKFQRLAPTGFDEFDNPIYDSSKWQPLLVDPIHQRRQKKGTLPPLYGGNEMAPFYGLHWIQIAGGPDRGFYVADSFGRSNPDGIDTAGSYFSQVKLTRYLPRPDGGYRPIWRVGRKALGLRESGEVYANHYLTGAAHGLVGVFDSNGLYHVFHQDGFYVDTLGVDAFRHGLSKSGMYAGGGEHWYGSHYKSEVDGTVYLCMGRAQMTVYKVPEWQPGRVQALTVKPKTIRLTAGSIAPPKAVAAELRGGDNQVKLANFHFTTGAPAPNKEEDWADVRPVKFRADARRTVQVQCKFDAATVYLRWQVSLGETFQPVMVTDMSRLFTRKTAGDTLSFYIQGDPQAPPAKAAGRPGDMRLVFAIVKDDTGKVYPVALGMYPHLPEMKSARPVTYKGSGAQAHFDHVGILEAVKVSYKLDADKRGFQLTAAIPVAVIPKLDRLAPGFRTMVNFEATLNGRRKFWWANTADLAEVSTKDPAAAARLYPGSWSQARFLPEQ